MKSKISLNLIEEGFVLYSIWKVNKYHDNGNINILELNVNKDLIKKYSKLFPLTKETKKCGSFEYRYCKHKCMKIIADNDFLNHDNFNSVLFYSEFNFVKELVQYGIQEASKEIEKYRKRCIKQSKGEKPKHTQCKLNSSGKCLCPINKITHKGLIRTKSIGLGVEPITKIPRISSLDVVKDKVTTVKNKSDKHILYVPGWTLDDDK